MKYDIFISYSRKDKEFARKVCVVLDKYKEKCSFEYFFDTEEIESGNEYLERISAAIKDSKTLLFIASKNSYGSEFCSKELLFADKHKVSIHQYRIDNAPMPLAIDMLLGTYQYREAATTSVESLIDELLRIMGIVKEDEPLQPLPSPPMPPVVKEMLGITIQGAVVAVLASCVGFGPGIVCFIFAIKARNQWKKNNPEQMMEYLKRTRIAMKVTFICVIVQCAIAIQVLFWLYLQPFIFGFVESL